MPNSYQPTKDDASFETFSGLPVTDPKIYTGHDPINLNAKHFYKPVQDEILKLIDIELAGSGALKVRNQTGTLINSGTCVAVTGYNKTHERFLITPSCAEFPDRPAQFVLTSGITWNANGLAYAYGTVTQLNTSAGINGDPVFLAATTSGAWTFTRPTAAGTQAHEIGKVTFAHSGLGTIHFYPAANFIHKDNRAGTLAGDVTGPTLTNVIANSAVSGNKIQALSILEGHLGNGVVSNGKLALSSISGNVIQSNAILNGHLSSASISGNVIGAGAILNGHLGNSVVTNGKLALASISGNVIQANAILNGHLANGCVSGQAIAPGAVQCTQISALGTTEVHTSASLGSNQNNYDAGSAGQLRLQSSVSIQISGFAGGTAGRIILLHNIGANPITLLDESTSSTDLNRIALYGDPYILYTDMTALLQYDATTQRWRLFGPQGAPFDVPYLTLSANNTLLNERVLSGNSTITMTDNGSNSTCVIGVANAAISGNRFYANAILPGHINSATFASAAEQESGSETTKIVAPATQHRHPSAAKGWIYFSATDTTPDMVASYNAAGSITDGGAGTYTVNWDTDFSSANFCSLGCGNGVVRVVGFTAGTTQIYCTNMSDVPTDFDYLFVAAFGDQ